MIKALPYIILGVFATVAIVLYISGCAITKDWLLMTVAIPAVITCILALILMPMLDSSYSVEGCAIFTPDSTMFFLIAALVSTIALPCVFYHCKTVDSLCFGMHLGGDAVVLIGFFVFLWAVKKVEDE